MALIHNNTTTSDDGGVTSVARLLHGQEGIRLGQYAGVQPPPDGILQWENNQLERSNNGSFDSIGGGAGGGGQVTFDATGQIDGITAEFTITNGYVAGSIDCFRNGIKERKSAIVETDPATGLVTVPIAPENGEYLEFWYKPIPT